MPQREGQVRPEFQTVVPERGAAKWYPAAELARRVRAQLRSGVPRWEASGRIPSDHHFVFRGGHGTAAHVPLPDDGFGSARGIGVAIPPGAAIRGDDRVDETPLQYYGLTEAVYHTDPRCPVGLQIPRGLPR